MLKKLALFLIALILPTADAQTQKKYQILDTETVKEYLWNIGSLRTYLGGQTSEWKAKEVGDGNLNLVFIVEGPDHALVVKQALPYVRVVGESWPLSPLRAFFEKSALSEQMSSAPNFVPKMYHYDHSMYLIAMEYLNPHMILRKGLINGIKYPDMAKHIGEFLAFSLFRTSDLHLSSESKRAKMKVFLENTVMCKISEDLIFDEPYTEAPLNKWTSPQLDDAVAEIKSDEALRLAVQNLKWKFLNNPEALLHGDLHTGSVMVTDTDTRIIDPEFAFYGPMGFDIGKIMANLLLAYFAQDGLAKYPGERDEYKGWILNQIPAIWETFSEKFASLWRVREAEGSVYQGRVISDEMLNQVIEKRLASIWADTAGFMGAFIIRRTIGMAHVADFESIVDKDARASCERKALTFARKLIVEDAPSSPEELIRQH